MHLKKAPCGESQKRFVKPSHEALVRSEKPSRKTPKKSSKVSSNKFVQKDSKMIVDNELQKKNSKSTSKAVVMASHENLESNLKAYNTRQSRYCAICKKNFFTKQLLDEHNIKHHSFRHCPNCPKSFQRSRKFILHLRSHIEDHPYECKICLESFNQKGDLLAHKGVHRNSSSLRCDICPEVFPHLASLNRHRLAHDGPPYPCNECSAIFSNVPDRTVHTKNHVHRCIMCPKEVVAFPFNVDLATHMYKDHRPENFDPAEVEKMNSFEPCVSNGAVNLDEDGTDSMDDFYSSDEESDSDEDSNYDKDAVESVYNLKRRDKFICFICYDLYPTSELLKSHMKAHNWFPCNSCSQFFPNAETFKKHQCNFTEVPIFRCKKCNSECENCKNKLVTEDRNLDVMNELQSIATQYPEMVKYGITNYTNVTQRNWLHSFIQLIKSQEKPLDLESLNRIGLHNSILEIILKNSEINRLFPRECIPDLEELYSKFQNLSRILLHRINLSSIQ